MGSYNMAVNKILSVLLVAGSTPAWTNPQFNFNFNNNIGTERPISSTTPVPILRYVDTQNVDGSYTYGYEAADGTYKLETRFVDGRVKGKYGYIDPEGNLREASYGAEAGRGFQRNSPTSRSCNPSKTVPKFSTQQQQHKNCEWQESTFEKGQTCEGHSCPKAIY